MCIYTSSRNKVLRRGSGRAMLLRMTTAMNRRPTDTLPLRLVMLRHEASVSQREAAFRCGITPRVWQGMEEGRSTAKLLDILKRIADEFGYDRDWLAYGGPLSERTAPRPGGDDDTSPAASAQSPLSGSNGRPLAYLVHPRPALVPVPTPGQTAA